MGVFRFKHFNVVNERSAMKVNTDGVLLGASMTVMPGDRRMLDIGMGTGTIALMAAQRVLGIPGQAGNDWKDAGNDVVIDAIDIDEPSASEAAMNFDQSPWAESLKAHNMSLDQFAATTSEKYDLIFSNPPYFEDSLTAPDERKALPDTLPTAFHTGIYSILPRNVLVRMDVWPSCCRLTRRWRYADTAGCAGCIFSASIVFARFLVSHLHVSSQSFHACVWSLPKR